MEKTPRIAACYQSLTKIAVNAELVTAGSEKTVLGWVPGKNVPENYPGVENNKKTQGVVDRFGELVSI